MPFAQARFKVRCISVGDGGEVGGFPQRGRAVVDGCDGCDGDVCWLVADFYGYVVDSPAFVGDFLQSVGAEINGDVVFVVEEGEGEIVNGTVVITLSTDLAGARVACVDAAGIGVGIGLPP